MEGSTWYGLDNQAKIYPAVSNDKNTNVFRISFNLNEMINPQILTAALKAAMPSFPYYSMVIKRGLFWFYLEPTDEVPVVKMEAGRPMSRIFHMAEKNLLFNVTYFGKRINLEVFHALADGGGAMELLRTIVYNYILLAHEDDFTDQSPVLDRGAAPSDQAEDSFEKYYTNAGERLTSRKVNRAFSVGDTLIPNNDISIITAQTPVKQVLALAKESGTSLTAYFAALLISAIEAEAMPKRYSSRDICIRVPVDLRGMFPSQSFRNFFSIVDIRYNFDKSPGDFSSILTSVTKQIKENVTPEMLLKTLNYNMSAQENIFARAVPLFIKNKVLKLIYMRNEANCTTILSNLGVVKMPKELTPYIHSVDALANPTDSQRIKLVVLSCGDTLTLTFTSIIAETDIQKHFIQHLSKNGVDISLSTNRREADEKL